MEDTLIINRIKEMGFSEYEAKCYLALFERKSLAVSEISKLTRIARTNTYDAMDKLLKRGLVVSMPGKTKKYRVSDPSILSVKSLELFEANAQAELEALERKRQELLDQKIKEINLKKKAMQKSIDNIVGELNSLYESNRENKDPLEYIEVIKDFHQSHIKYLELLGKSQREVLTFSREPYMASSQLLKNEQDKIQEEVASRGVILRAIYQMPPEEVAHEYFAAMNVRPGAALKPQDQTRIIDKLPIKLVVLDDYACMFTLEDPVENMSSITSLVTEHKAMAISFRFLFESFWEKAKDYYVVGGKKFYVND